MKAPARWVLLVVPLLITGCFHKQAKQPPQPVAPELAQTPPPAPAPVIATTPPDQAQATAPVSATPTESAAPAQPAPGREARPPAHHATRTDKPEQEPADTAKTPAVEAIGQLSSGEPGTAKKDVQDSIAATEYRLRQITRPLSDQEQKTVVQIKEFLKQAHAALESGDTDGANTLAVKAKVLLSELTD